MCRRNYKMGCGISIRIGVSLDTTSVYRWLTKGAGCKYCNGEYDDTIEQELGLSTRNNNTTSGP